MASNSTHSQDDLELWIGLPPFLSAKITGVCHHAQFM